MNAQVHSTEPSGEPVQRAVVRAPALIDAMFEGQYEQMNAERADDGLGPFCGSYAEYLRVVEQHNAAVACLAGERA